MSTNVFLDQKRVNVCEHIVKMAPRESSVKSAIRRNAIPERGRSGGKIEWKPSEVYTRAVSRGQNELIGKFKMATDNVISISG